MAQIRFYFKEAETLLFVSHLCSVLVLTVCSSVFVDSSTFAQRPAQRRRTTATPQSGAAHPAANDLTAGARASLDAAVAALQRDDLAGAERSARAAIAESPRSAVPHNILGVILEKAGHADQAFQEFTTAIRLDPNFVSAHNNIGRMLAEQGKTAQAIEEFERVLRIEPNHLQAHYNLGALYGDAGDFAKAAEHFARARAAAPDDPQLALAFLNVAYRANRAVEANAAADMIERNYARDARALFTLATALAQNEQYERASKIFTRVNEMMPHTFEVLYNLGVTLYNLDRNDEAAHYLSEAADINPAPAETHVRLGLIASQRGDHANAIIEFKHGIERDQRNPNLHYLLGREYFNVGYWDGAISEYTAAMQLDARQTIYVLARANANYRKGEWAASAADFDLAASIDPNIENIEYMQGYAQRAAGNFDRAREFLEKFLAKHPEHVDALASLGYVRIEQGRFEEAEAPLRRALELQPENVPVLYDYARLALKKRDYEEAARRLQRVIERNPTHTQAHYQLFLAYSRLHQTERAQVELAEFKRLEELERQVKQERILEEHLRTQQMLGLSPQ